MSLHRVLLLSSFALVASTIVACSGGAGEETEPAAVKERTGTAKGAYSQVAPLPVAIPVEEATLVLDEDGDFPLVFRAPETIVKAVSEGFEVNGDLTFDTPLGPFYLSEAELVFTWSSDHSKLEAVRGTVQLPAPSLGALSDFAYAAPPARATIGWDTGANLRAAGVEAPILDDRKYIAFDYETGLSASAGPISVAAPGGKAGTLVIDPRDPSFYMTGGFIGLDQLGPLSDVALGLSARGLLQFEPQETWGVENDAKPFGGHLYAKGTVNLVKIPIAIDGELVLDVDPKGNGRRLGEGAPDGLELGANGTVRVSVDFAKIFNFSAPLGHATVAAMLTSQEQRAYMSGVIGVDVDWMPTLAPFTPQRQTRVAAYISNDILKSYFAAETSLLLKANKFYSLVPSMPKFGLQDAELAAASFRVDATGLRVIGRAKTPLVPIVRPKAELLVDAFLPVEKPEDFSMSLTGDLSVANLPLANASARIDKTGMRANGTFKTPVSNVALAGSIQQSGAELEGDVSFSLRGTREEVQVVVDGAYCGVTYVKDAAKCGTTTITDGAQCGWDIVKSGWKCLLSAPKFNKCKKKPKSCKIANTCAIPNSCPKPVSIPNYDFGKFAGKLRVAANSSGASGSMSGKLCKGSVCSSLGSSSVTLSSNPKACFSGIPQATGPICVEF
ncbi:MAG TPA: hypothetical protein VM580_26430 [Labilithrix sp.]|nr:hypothetical protein [Labilithrix sp.]